MKPSIFATILLPIAAALATPALASTPVTLDRSVTVLENPNESPAVLRAERDLESDLQKVFGHAPRVVHIPDAATGLLIVVTSDGLPNHPAAPPESFSITLESTAPQGKRILHLAGTDPRGAIYAIYTFSQRFLGVDPMYFWTDLEPTPRTSIALPATLPGTVESPVFQYRGFFINDEDLLTGWSPGAPGEGTGISLHAWDKIYETILRLKGNMVVPGSWSFPDDPQMAAAAARGLILAQHHATPLGVNVARWPKDAPYNYTTHPEVLRRAWRNAVAAYAPGEEVLWSVGLRGLTDGSYDSADPSVRGNDQALGAVISSAIADQIAIVRQRFPYARFITNLWQEGARLVNEGYLHIPPEVTLVWADSGVGDLQDHGEVKAGEGAYYHVAMMDGASNQLSELVPVDRIYSELGRFQDAHATAYLLLNTSDIRPVIMTTRAVMDVAWSGVPAQRTNAAAGFYAKWAAQQYGPAAAPQIAPLFKLYFDAPAQNLRNPKPLGDQGYHDYARQMVLDAMFNIPTFFAPDQVPTWKAPIVSEGDYGRGELPKLIKHIQASLPSAQLRWDTLWTRALAAEKLVPAARRPAYEAQVLTMIAVNRQSNRMLLATANSIQSAAARQQPQAIRQIQAAQQSLAELSTLEHAAEYGKWKNWYRGDWLVGVPRTTQDLATYERYLKDPLAPVLPPLIWSSWEAYFHILNYEGDRTVDVQ
jgi:hypothetical protein